MRKIVLGALGFVALSSVALAFESHEAARNSIIWNRMENQVAVIKGPSRHGAEFLVVHPTKKFSGLGRYQVVMPKDSLRPRPKGGWYTSITIDELPYLPPELPQYFQPSGT